MRHRLFPYGGGAGPRPVVLRSPGARKPATVHAMAIAGDVIVRAREVLSGHAAGAGAWHGITGTPDDLGDATRCAIRHARALATAHRLHAALREAGVRPVFLKGPLLQEWLYADAGTRPFSDLDVAVSPRDAAAARRVLAGLGWRNRTPLYVRPLHFHDVFTQPDGDALPVELHRTFVDRANLYRIPADAWFARAQPYRVPGGDLPGLEPEDLLVYLCLHAHKHGFLNEPALASGRGAEWFLRPGSGNRLLWFVDIALLLDRLPELSALAHRIRTWNVVAPLATTLRVLDLVLPGSAAKRAAAQLDLEAWRPRPGSRRMHASVDRIAHGMGMTLGRTTTLRPARILQLPGLLVPPPDELAGFLGRPSVGAGARWLHPLRMAARLVGLESPRADTPS